MKELTLNSADTIKVDDTSTKEKLVLICKKFAEIDTSEKKMTAEALEGAKLDGEAMENIKTVSLAAARDNGGAITCTVSVAYKTDLEILSDRVAETSDAVNALIMGGVE